MNHRRGYALATHKKLSNIDGLVQQLFHDGLGDDTQVFFFCYHTESFSRMTYRGFQFPKFDDMPIGVNISQNKDLIHWDPLSSLLRPQD
jgi:hypothetical protein